jgi:hypothetical protein
MDTDIVNLGVMLIIQLIVIVAFLVSMKKDIGFVGDRLSALEKRINKIEDQESHMAVIEYHLKNLDERLRNLEGGRS